jgi:hypothetical protein
MPSLEHEAPLEVIRQQPDVVADLLRRVLPQLRLPDRVTGALGSADMSQVAPAQYFADMVVVLSDQQTNKPVIAVVIEPQGRDRKTKKVSWPVYLTTAIKANKVPRAIEQAGASHADTAALSTIILGVADAAARGELEALMASPKFHSTFVDGLLQQGEVKSKSEDLIKVIKARGLELTQAQLELVTSCADLSQLAAWFDRALDAETSDEIFSAP